MMEKAIVSTLPDEEVKVVQEDFASKAAKVKEFSAKIDAIKAERKEFVENFRASEDNFKAEITKSTKMTPEQFYFEIKRVMETIGEVKVNYDNDNLDLPRFRTDNGKIINYKCTNMMLPKEYLRTVLDNYDMIAHEIKDEKHREAFIKFFQYVNEQYRLLILGGILYKTINEPIIKLKEPRKIYRFSSIHDVEVISGIEYVMINKHYMKKGPYYSIALMTAEDYRREDPYRHNQEFTTEIIKQIPELNDIITIKQNAIKQHLAMLQDIHDKANELLLPWLTVYAI